MRGRSLALVVTVLSALSMPLAAQQAAAPEEDFVRSHYTKFEYRIPMRDGARLFTSVYVPQTTAFKDHGPYPFLVTRTPYSCAPYGEDQYKKSLAGNPDLEKGGYIFVCQDVRGHFQSEGEFVEMRPHIDEKKSPKDVDDSSDMSDTVDYLLKHVPNNNGNVGIYGISYPGYYTSASIIDSHPAIKAASPQAPMTDLFLSDDTYHGGAFMLDANFSFYAAFFLPQKTPVMPGSTGREFKIPTPDMYSFYLQAGPTANLEKYIQPQDRALFHDQLAHTTYDSYWQARDLSRHMKNIKAATMVVGGWFDAEDLSGPFKTFHAIDRLNPGNSNTLVIGPWVHGGWARSDGDHLGDVTFGAKTSAFYRSQIEAPFFEQHLKGHTSQPLPKAYAFETGTNVWRSYDAWPPKPAKPAMLYFHAGGKLSFTPPTTTEPGKDEYISDPAHPVPYTGYITDSVPQRYMVDDQRFASQRPDVLTYVSDPLTEDFTIAGPVSPKLHIASTGTDADFVVKLIDVYPDDYPNPQESQGKRVTSAPPLQMGGYQQMLRGEPMRAKFRNSWEKPEALPVNKQVALNFTMPDLHHTFRAGHRIMVQVQSSWFPLVDRNPQTFTDIPTAKPEQFVKATQTVFHTPGAPSGVEVLTLPQP